MAPRVLSALDAAKTQYYHFKAIIIAGMGLFTDAYDLFCIPPILKLIGRAYYPPPHHQTPAAVATALLAVALVGAVIGHLALGRLGDTLGRRRVYGFTLMLMVLSSLGCGFSVCTRRGCVLASLGFFRFLLGVGIGGDYPLSATIMSEFANRRTRGSFIAAVFTMQGFGILASSAVTMTVCAVFDRFTARGEAPVEVDLAWRIILMIGALPAALTFYWRMMMPETARYTALVEQNVVQAAKDMEKVLDISLAPIAEDSEYPTPNPNNTHPFTNTTNTTNTSFNPSSSYPILSPSFLRRHGRNLFSCAAAWLLLDVVFYGSNLFQSEIYRHYLPNDNNSSPRLSAFQEAFHVAKFQAIVAACSTIPGYWAAVCFIDRVGRVKIQAIGFSAMALLYLAMGIAYYAYWVRHANLGFMFLFGLTFFFSNAGPNTATFIVPAELFPARSRATCHGFCGAAGKVGAIIGSVGFLWASHKKEENGYPKGIGMAAWMVILSGTCAAGAVATFLFTPETMGRSLEENENDEEGISVDHHESCVERGHLSSLGFFAKSSAVQSHASPNN